MTAWLLVGAGVLLTLGTAVFVAAEFSLVSLDPSRVEGKHAGRVRKALKTLSTQLSGAQVGITLTTVLLGFTAQPAIVELLNVPLDNSGLSRAAIGVIAGVLSVLIVNGFSMIFGELVPKNLALSEPMRVAGIAAPLNSGFTTALRPLIAVLNGCANAILRSLGIEPKEELAGGRSPQELAALVRRSAEAGTLAATTALLVTKTIELDELAADDVMTDRTRLRVIAADAPVAEVLDAARATGHTRFPVVGEGTDDVLGMINLLAALSIPVHDRATTPASAVMVDVLRIPETMRMRPLLGELKDAHLQCAIVVDEYGGTAGMVTLEDLVEELIGEVADEHDRRRPAMHQTAGAWVIPGDLRPDEVRQRADLAIPESSSYETVGGYVMQVLGRVPRVGDTFEADGLRIVVEHMDGRRVDRVRIVAAEVPE
jgi:CBS domain containing-hemolysin-like protein